MTQEATTNVTPIAPSPTAAVPAPSRMQLAPVADEGEFSALLDSNRFGQIQRVAKLFAESTLVPEVFQKQEANCAVALQMAFRLRVDPMMLMQNMYIVHGRPGIEAKLAIALMNQRGPFTGPLQWRFQGEGDGRSCTCYATHRATGALCEQTVTWAMVVAEGWLSKSGSKWKTMPDIMFQYRSAMFLGRLYCPEVLLGLPTDDELRDIGVERAIAGEVIETRQPIDMPRAREIPAEVDPATGETSAPAGGEAQQASTETKAPSDATNSAASATNGTQDATPGSDVAKADAKAAQPVDEKMKRKASDAQRRMIIKTAQTAGLSVAQLDEHLVERFSMGVDELPMGLVNDALELISAIKNGKGSASAA